MTPNEGGSCAGNFAGTDQAELLCVRDDERDVPGANFTLGHAQQCGHAARVVQRTR